MAEQGIRYAESGSIDRPESSPSVTVLLLEAAAGRHVALLAAHGIAAVAVPNADALLERLAREWGIAAIVLDLELATPELLARLAHGPRLIALCDAAAADMGGLALAANLADFCAPDVGDAELLAVVGAALDALPALQVADLSDRGAARIGALSAEVERIASALATLAAAERGAKPGISPGITAVQVRGLIKQRRLRERYFPAELFSDPAWDMLLDLTAARIEQKPVSVSSLCIAAAVPTTTALRWIRSLCDAGMFVRQTDPSDARRAFIALSDAAATSMAEYLAASG